MEAKIRIIEVSPKLKCFKNNPKDIISISFISDNYSVKIEDLEKAILSNDKIIINLKESKNKNIYLPIKYSLIRNNNSIISTGEFIPFEGIKWYKLNEIKNNISKESLITSSTSNGNIKANNINRRAHNLSDSNNSYANEPNNNLYSKNNYNQLNNNSVLNNIKIKFSIIFLNKKNNLNKKNITNNNHYNSIINNNYTKEPSENSSKYGELLLNKDIFNEEEFTITESDISKLNLKKKISTTSKKFNNQKKLSSGIQSKKFSKKKINFNANQSLNPSGPTGGGEILIKSPTRKTNNNLIIKKYFNEDIKMKTSIGFNKKRIQNENRQILSENKYISKKGSNNMNNNEIPRKINSSENIEDKIFDQNFKNYLKNDEILKANLSRNNSFNNLDQNNNLKSKTTNLQNNTYISNNDFPETTRSKITDNNDNKKIKKKYVPKNINTNSLLNDLQLKTSSDIEYAISESVPKNIDLTNENKSFENICITNTNNENFERLKSDFLLLYSDDISNKINDDVLFLEIQLMIEKILSLQNKHQKEYIDLFNSINLNKKINSNYQNKYVSLIKQKNKLDIRKLQDDIINRKKELYKESINNFIKIRKKIMDKGEFKIWNNMMENSNKTQVIDNNKNKIIKIFLNICKKNENHLNKLSLKFYKEIKNKQIKKNNVIKAAKTKPKIGKLNTNSNFFSAKKSVNIKMRIKENETEINLPNLRTNHNTSNNLKINPTKNKFKTSNKNSTKMNINNDEINSSSSKNNNFNFGTMMNENLKSHYNNYNLKKRKNNKYKPSSIGDKIYHKKKCVNKSQ